MSPRGGLGCTRLPTLPEGVPWIDADPVNFYRAQGVSQEEKGATLPAPMDVQVPKSFMLQGT